VAAARYVLSLMRAIPRIALSADVFVRMPSANIGGIARMRQIQPLRRA